MKYSTEPRKIKYFEGYSFLSFARKFGDKYGKNLMDTKTRIDCNWTRTQLQSLKLQVTRLLRARSFLIFRQL